MKISRIARVVLAVAALAGYFESVQAASLYKESSYQPLASDRKAHQPGDLLTVLVYENSSATSTANTTAGRDAGVGVNIETPGTSKSASIRTNNQLDGRGQTQRVGRVLAQITVTVKGVTPGGDLLVAGEQLLEVNNERQQIKVEGRVRPQDISDTNTVLSTRIADAKISYVGEGDLADRQRPSWWQRLLTMFGL
ncbi:MAG: flagellar basal body L-ring protein FlgH [Burkholderiales bacterium]|nr:flagellar basal body L-ring protein FlgH [Burkholderiales bacterium]